MRAWVLALLILTVPLAGCTDEPSPDDGKTPEEPEDGTPDEDQDEDGSDSEQPHLALEPLLTGLEQPVDVAFPQPGSSRIFIVQQTGQVLEVLDGQIQDGPLLDLSADVSDGFEQGLLSIALVPGFQSHGKLLASFTDAGGDTVLARFTLDPPSGHTIDPATREDLLTLEQPYGNHNGGLALYGPDGHLYLGLGDGGSGGDPQENGQDTSTLLGSILRLDIGPEGPLEIPADNPFVGEPGRDEIWAYGLRNPWRFSFDEPTRDLWIGDVGQSSREEINREPGGSQGGANYGWDAYEGSEVYEDEQTVGTPVFPVTEYETGEDGCAVTGGSVYRGEAIPALEGTYVFADYCSGTIWGLDRDDGDWERTVLLETDANIASFDQTPEGDLLVLDHQGTVFELAPAQG